MKPQRLKARVNPVFSCQIRIHAIILFPKRAKCVLGFFEKKHIVAADFADSNPDAGCIFKKQRAGFIQIN